MTLKINHPDVDKLLQELVEVTGESAPQAVANALQERLEREKAKQLQRRSVKNELLRISRECAALPVLDPRTPDEILGYDDIGVPT